MQTNCPHCNKEIDSVFVYFNTGALRRINEHSAVMDENLSGFFHLGWHDHDSNHPSVDIEKDAQNGQIEMYFCNPDCMENWFVTQIRKLK